MSSAKSPTDFVQFVTGRPVVVKLNDGLEYRGVLACIDSYLNVALSETEEIEPSGKRTQIGDAFIRGNNVFFVGTQE